MKAGNINIVTTIKKPESTIQKKVEKIFSTFLNTQLNAAIAHRLKTELAELSSELGCKIQYYINGSNISCTINPPRLTVESNTIRINDFPTLDCFVSGEPATINLIYAKNSHNRFNAAYNIRSSMRTFLDNF